jgi:hypothetical protein
MGKWVLGLVAAGMLGGRQTTNQIVFSNLCAL